MNKQDSDENNSTKRKVESSASSNMTLACCSTLEKGEKGNKRRMRIQMVDDNVVVQ